MASSLQEERSRSEHNLVNIQKTHERMQTENKSEQLGSGKGDEQWVWAKAGKVAAVVFTRAFGMCLRKPNELLRPEGQFPLRLGDLG